MLLTVIIVLALWPLSCNM